MLRSQGVSPPDVDGWGYREITNALTHPNMNVIDALPVLLPAPVTRIVHRKKWNED